LRIFRRLVGVEMVLRDRLPPAGPTTLEEPAAPVPYDESPFARERHVWLGLHAAATRSLAQGSMIIFS
ncbi:hypothetical protein PV405_34280, partial [Streptomyces sp. ME02-6979-3A]|nr:hypothetical protein [Streptomyces sp. ME02-6979-3A]